MSAETATTAVTVADPPTYALALEEARRALDQQLDDVAVVRTRAIQLLSGGGIAVSVFGGLTIRSGPPDQTGPTAVQPLLVAVAFVAFVAVAIFCVLVLKSRPLKRTTNPLTLVEWVEVPDVTNRWMERRLALALGETYDANLKTVNAMYRDFRWLLIALIAEVAALIAAFAGGLF